MIFSSRGFLLRNLAVGPCRQRFQGLDKPERFSVGASRVHAKIIYSYVRADGLQKFLVCTHANGFLVLKTKENKDAHVRSLQVVEDGGSRPAV